MNNQTTLQRGRHTLVEATFTKCGLRMGGFATVETRDLAAARKLGPDAIIQKYHFVDPGTQIRIDRVSHFL